MFMHKHWDPEMWLWALETPFGQMVMTMTFLTWTLIIINLIFVTLWFVHHFFGKKGVFRGKK
jgi:hypothetical protein